jgi:hypothetical protein
MLSHGVLCSIVGSALSGSEYQALRNKLFAMPNRWLGTANAPPLIRRLPIRAWLARTPALPTSCAVCRSRRGQSYRDTASWGRIVSSNSPR